MMKALVEAVRSPSAEKLFFSGALVVFALGGANLGRDAQMFLFHPEQARLPAPVVAEEAVPRIRR